MKIVVKNSEMLRQRILKKGYSVRSYSRAIDVSDSHMSQIVNCQRNPGPEIAKKMAALLDASFEEIFEFG
ncbi:helix-turn-helix transcriptional regulator [Paenibacillus sp. MMO-58]|uniref:helix-turn-helix transcriptional regulator n=1 Tax=Paenibacillus sp. MMO-58 TaxID=3081290 RepID=UPI00301A6F3A